MPRFRPNELLSLATAVIERLGTRSDDASVVAEHLVAANLAGHDSHGIVRLVQYRDHVVQGRVDPDAQPEVVRERGATALIDGHWAWGQVVAKRAFDLALAKAREFGTGSVAVHGAYHIGRVGVYPENVAREGAIAVVFANGHGVARVAPWGGTEARLATNPLAIAVPTRSRPVVIDITTSVVAEGKVRIARNANRAIPEGWVLDRNGQATTDPADLYDGGTLLPLGGREGHKGYGLSIAVDLLGGILSSAGCGVMTKEIGNGLSIQVTDPEAFEDREAFLDRVEAYLAYLRSSARRPGIDRILLPGEPEQEVSARRLLEGIEIDEGTWSQVGEVAKQLGVAL